MTFDLIQGLGSEEFKKVRFGGNLALEVLGSFSNDAFLNDAHNTHTGGTVLNQTRGGSGDIAVDNDKNKALAVFVGTWTDGKLNEKTGKWEQFADGHAEADTYGALKYVKDPADKKAKILDRTVKSIKYVDGSVKCTIKTFKAGKKTVEEQIAAYIAKITKKAPAKK